MAVAACGGGEDAQRSPHREVKKWMQLIRSKMSQDQSVVTQTLMLEKTSTLKESLHVFFLDSVMQKLFNSETPAGRNLEVPRRQIDVGYNVLEEAKYNPCIRSGEWNDYSYSDLSNYESSSQEYENSEDFESSMADQSPFSLLVGTTP